MISFLNDYNELCHPKILEDMLRLQAEPNPGYGNDQHCEKAISYLKKEMGDKDVDIHFVHGGTMANILAIKSILRPYQGVVSCESGHILGHENGSIEASGHQIIQVENVNGKVTIDALSKALSANSHEYSVEPKLVYISNATEFGSVYTLEELKALRDFCNSQGLYIYMDGARLATALASDLASYKMADLVDLVDIFTIGGTKNGFLFGEALVFTNKELSQGFRKLLKQRGAMLAKGFALGMQFESMFEDGLYFRLAEDSINLAKKLAKIFEDKGISLYSAQESNLVFPILSKSQIEKLSKDFYFEVMDELPEGKALTRFVLRYVNTQEDLEKLDEALKNCD